MFRRQSSGEETGETGFLAEMGAEERRDAGRELLRWAAVFAMLFAGVFFAFWWSGAAVRFGAARVADKAVPTWRVEGVVRDASTGAPVPWAKVADDPGGQPPYYETEADQNGAFALLTLAELHKIQVTAPGYRTARVSVGRQWFLWMPGGTERIHIVLVPLQY